MIILVSYVYQPSLHGTTFELLVFRSICDAGLGVRFMFEPRISTMICDSQECYYSIPEDSLSGINVSYKG